MSAASNCTAAGSKPSSNRSIKSARADRDADESKDSGADQPTQSAAHVAPVTRLYRHALESIFAFLDLRELGRVLSVSRSWSAAVRSMASIGASVASPRVPPSVMAASGLVSHVIQFGSSPFVTQCSCHDLHILRQSFPALTTLGCSVLMLQPEPLVFSHKLRTVWIELRGDATTAASIQETISTLSQLPQLTELGLMLAGWLAAVDFSPLLKSASLRHLRLKSQAKDSQPTAAQIDQLRSLAHLQTMDVSVLDSAPLGSLLRTPHHLQWQQIGRVELVDEVQAAALACLPTLTYLEAHFCFSVSFLHSLPRLRTLDLRASRYGTAVSANIVAAGLRCCPELTTLSLQSLVQCAHMRTILAALPLLTDLTLVDCDQLESLRFFASVDWSQRASLVNLSIVHPTRPGHLPVISAVDLYCLRGLTSLTLHWAFPRPLPEMMLRPLQPPSQILPLLTEFSYRQ